MYKRQGNGACPDCRENLSQEDIFPDLYTTRQIMQLMVRCKNKDKRPCEWRGTLTQLAAHMRECVVLDPREYQQRVSLLEEQNTELKEHVQELNLKFEAVQGQFGALQGENAELKQKNALLERRVGHLEGRLNRQDVVIQQQFREFQRMMSSAGNIVAFYVFY